MANGDTTSPQMKLISKLLSDYGTRDLSDVGRFLSKDFKFQSFPETTNHPEETRGEHLENWGGTLASFAKMEPIVHEIIEAPGKVVLHVTFAYTTPDGAKLDYDTVLIVSLAEEDGELKVLGAKDFSDPKKRGAMHTTAKTLAKGVLVS